MSRGPRIFDLLAVAATIGFAALVAWATEIAPPLLGSPFVWVFLVPAGFLVLVDWAQGPVRDSDFGLALDVALLSMAPSLGGIALVAMRRLATLAVRQVHGPLSRGVVYVGLPPCLLAAGSLALVRVLGIGPPLSVAAGAQGATRLLAAAVLGAAYVLLDAVLARWVGSNDIFVPWAAKASVRSYGVLWASEVAVAMLLVLMWDRDAQPAVALTVLVASLLLLSLRLAYGLLRQVLTLYSATAEALVAALAATLPEQQIIDTQVAAESAQVAERLGLPATEIDRVRSAAWLLSLVRVGEQSGVDFSPVLAEPEVLPDETARVMNVVAGLEGGQSPTQSDMIAALIVLMCAERHGLVAPQLRDAEAAVGAEGSAATRKVVYALDGGQRWGPEKAGPFGD